MEQSYTMRLSPCLPWGWEDPERGVSETAGSNAAQKPKTIKQLTWSLTYDMLLSKQ